MEVASLGVQVEPDEVAAGGTNFLCDVDLEKLRGKLLDYKAEGRMVALHVAPPCSTFSRARDRSRRTRLRSAAHPAGLPRCGDQVNEANKVALAACDLATWAAERGMLVSLENPRKSYLWEFLAEERPGAGGDDHVFCACMHGAPYQKPTTLRCWNWSPKSLVKMCVLQGGQFSCGRSQEVGHEVLEFGGRSTGEAAAYAPGVCKAWASDLANALLADTSLGAALQEVSLHREGRVRRHTLRGTDAASTKEIRRQEDEASQAGMRNPARLVETWPRLWRTMAKIRATLDKAWCDFPELRGLTDACGKEPRREQPSEAVLRDVRKRLEGVLGSPPGSFEEHNAASPWRFNLVKFVQEDAGDPDVHLSRWLREGAPMGIQMPIEVGGLFPAVEPQASLSLDDLDLLERWSSNHPSFNEDFGEGEPPGVATVRGYLDSGFGRLFKDAAAASEYHGVRVHPAPMGNITKVLGDGNLKHRPIQDLRRNGVNDAVVVPERQVLPRPVDHARDVADLASSRNEGDELAVLILDFKDAFMSVPLHPREQPFNCTVLPGGVKRSRQALDQDEVEEGECIVWRVLGFGGKPNPLVYSRAASFAMRSGQVGRVNTRGKHAGSADFRAGVAPPLRRYSDSR